MSQLIHDKYGHLCNILTGAPYHVPSNTIQEKYMAYTSSGHMKVIQKLQKRSITI